jgi:hypothetical protein
MGPLTDIFARWKIAIPNIINALAGQVGLQRLHSY